MHTTDTRDRILRYIKSNGQANNGQLRLEIKISQVGMSKQLKILLSHGKIIKIGFPPKHSYQLAPNFSLDEHTAKDIKKISEALKDEYVAKAKKKIEEAEDQMADIKGSYEKLSPYTQEQMMEQYQKVMADESLNEQEKAQKIQEFQQKLFGK